MSNGIYIEDHGFLPMRSRADLQGPGFQKALLDARCHWGRRVLCACRDVEGVFLEMKIVRGFERYRVDRRRKKDEHHPSCIFRLPDDDLPHEPPVPTSLIFDEQVKMPTSEGAGLGGSFGRGAMRFAQYARLLFASGYDAAWFAANENAETFRALRCPLPMEVLGSIERFIRTAPLADAPKGGYEGAAKTDGGLVFGLLESKLPSWAKENDLSTRVPLLLSGYRKGRLDYSFATATAGMIFDLREALSIFGNVIRPPYLFFAVLNEDWSIRRITLKPVLCDGSSITFVDSDIERRFFQHLRNQGIQYYRPLDTMAGFSKLANQLPLVDLAPGQRWPYRLDALAFDETTATVVELRGFEHGKFPEYDELFARKIIDWKKFCIESRGKLQFTELYGPDYEKTAISDGIQASIPRGMVRQILPQPMTVNGNVPHFDCEKGDERHE